VLAALHKRDDALRKRRTKGVVKAGGFGWYAAVTRVDGRPLGNEQVSSILRGDWDRRVQGGRANAS
jgi:hypothetical protein